MNQLLDTAVTTPNNHIYYITLDYEFLQEKMYRRKYGNLFGELFSHCVHCTCTIRWQRKKRKKEFAQVTYMARDKWNDLFGILASLPLVKCCEEDKPLIKDAIIELSQQVRPDYIMRVNGV